MPRKELFIGIDVAKDVLDVAVRPTGDAWQVANDDNGIARSHHGRKAPRPSRTVTSLGRIGVSQENRVVEIEKEPIRRPPEQSDLPGRQQFPLKNHHVSPA